jgi:hypothetical protein
MKTTLYQKDHNGSMRVWKIQTGDCELIMTSGVVGGNLVEKVEEVLEGKGGRTLSEQLLSRFNSRVSKKIDKGYLYSEQEAAFQGAQVNSLGLARPMLAKRYERVKGVQTQGAALQYKLDGHRCQITKQNGKTFAYSKNGKIIHTIDHILEKVKLVEGETIDGELYIHGLSLQKIGSYVKKQHAESFNLVFHAYDVHENTSYSIRYDKLKIIASRWNSDHLAIVETHWNTDPKEFPSRFRAARAAGYEGLMLRIEGAGYEAGKRSAALLKIKCIEGEGAEFDEEFMVIDILPSRDGWARLVCITKEGKQFKVSAPGSLWEKTQILQSKKAYIGMKVKIEFAGWTDDKIPFHPVAILFRPPE